MNAADFRTNIKTHMGGNLIDVELTDADLDECFAEAKQAYQQFGNDNLEKNWIALNVVTGTAQYDISADNISDIVRVARVKDVFTSSDPFSLAVFNDLMTTSRRLDMMTFELSLQHVELIRRYSGNEGPQFVYNRRTGILDLLKTPSKTEVWFLDCYKYSSDDTYRDHYWIQEWALAEAKEILGAAYSKYSSVSTPAGEVQLNGNDLKQEARDMKEQLRRDIDDYVDGDPTGGPIFMG